MSDTPLVLISGKDVLEGVGGHESYVRAHALAVTRLGFRPHIFCIGRRARTTTVEFGVVHEVAPHLPVVAQSPLLARAVVRFLIGRPGPHVIHGFAIWSVAAVLAVRALRRHGLEASAVASAYGTRAYEVGAMQDGLEHHRLSHRIRYGLWLRWIRSIDDHVERWGYTNAHVVLVNYESVRTILTSAYGRSLHIRKMPYTSSDAFLDGETLAPSLCPEPIAQLCAPEAPLVIAISRHDPRKGLDVLLIALAELAASGVSFRACLIGSGRLLDAHRRIAKDLGLAKRVAIVGRVGDTRPYLDRADVFVLPSLAEASGSVSIIEALRSGTAVIASACDGIPEDLADGSDALLCPPGDVRALTAALRAIVCNVDLRNSLAVAGRRTYEHRFSAAGFIAALRGVYADLGVRSTE